MTWNSWLQKASKTISKQEAILILIKTCNLGVDPSWFTIHGDEEIPKEYKKYLRLLDKKTKLRHSGTPLAYILQEKYFYGRPFYVGRGKSVLIPRPETENIIDIIKKIRPKTVLDIGTGSGCIAITIKLEMPNTKVYACDISRKALKIAEKNAKKLNAKIDIFRSNLLSNIKFTPDTIVANLPYVDKNWNWVDQKALSHEPSIALYAKNHGLSLIFKLIKQSSSYKIENLILEADPSQHSQIIEFANKNNYKLKDNQGFILNFTYLDRRPKSH